MWSRKTKSCSFCGGTNHTRMQCRLKPKRKRTRKAIDQRKRLRHYGKHGYLWDEVRKQWIEKHGSEHVCHYCGVRVSDNPVLLEQDQGLRKLTLDHIDARSRAPELRYVEDNLVPCCGNCNRKKGSKDHDDFPHACYTDLPERTYQLKEWRTNKEVAT